MHAGMLWHSLVQHGQIERTVGVRVRAGISVLTGEKQACETGEELLSQVQLHFHSDTVSESLNCAGDCLSNIPLSSQMLSHVQSFRETLS